MAERKINPVLKFALEFGPILAFFVGYLRLKDDTFTISGTEYDGFIVVTAAFVPLLLISTGILWALTGHLSRMQVVTAVLVVVFGGLSVWFNDDRFFKMKPTLIYVIFAGILGFGLMKGRSYLEYVMEGMIPLTSEGYMILTKRITFFFLGLAVANEVIWRTMSTDAWVNFKTFGLSAAIFAFFMTQGGLFAKYSSEESEDDQA
jgi:intracellular septation protein